MKLTTFTDYSLRVLMFLAMQPGQRTTIAQVAAAFEVSENHLVKVVHFLGQQGWLKNVRGKGGGLEMGLPPESIRVGEVVRRTEGDAIVARCFGDAQPGCAIGSCCRLRGALAQATAAFNAVLDSYTLADMTSNAGELARVLLPPRPLRPANAIALP